MKRQKFKIGAIVKIKFDEKHHTYGRLLVKPYVEIFDCKTDKDISDIELIVNSNVLFTLSVFNHAITKGRWEIIGKTSINEEELNIPKQFMQDVINPKVLNLIDAYGNIEPAVLEDCIGLERAAVWEPEHVEDRIRDHYDGKPNIWAENLKLKEI